MPPKKASLSKDGNDQGTAAVSNSNDVAVAKKTPPGKPRQPSDSIHQGTTTESNFHTVAGVAAVGAILVCAVVVLVLRARRVQASANTEVKEAEGYKSLA